MIFKIDKELKNLIPPLTTEERKQLKGNLLKDGIRDALVLGEYLDSDELITVLIDGHNRLEIANNNGLLYDTVTISFDNYESVKEWMILHQFGRRNLNNYQRSVLALELEKVFTHRAKENQGTRNDITSVRFLTNVDTKKELANIANVSHDTISRVKKINNQATSELKKQLEKGEVSINQAYKEVRKVEKKEERKELIQKQVEDIETGKLPKLKGKYSVISIDPPWNYGREYDPHGSRVANPYPEMSTKEIQDIKLPLLEDSILCLWTTHSFLPVAFDLLKGWELEYKATIVWDKESMGMGSWLRMQCEFCLIAIKGNPFWNNTKYRDIIRAKRRQHSRKPDEFFDIIKEVTAGRRLEYFSREKREGWDVFGNDLDKF